MKRSVWLRLDTLARQLSPFALSLLLLVLHVVPLGVPGLPQVAPLLPLMAVYHWAIYRPDLMPPAAVFVIGLLQDALTGVPVGINAAVLLLVYGGVTAQRRFFVGKSFAVIWMSFAMVAAVAALASWLLAALYHVTLLDARPVLVQFLLTAAVYPALAWALVRWQQAFLKAE